MKRYLIYLGSFFLALTLTFVINTWNEISIETPEGTIFGEIINAGNETLVIFTAGSGPTDRDGNSKYLDGKNNSLIGLATELKNSGISTFRYDKRAAGKSLKTFDIKNIVFEDFVEDLTSVIKYFRNEGKYKKIYLLGHSQGALVSVIAAQNEDIDGVIYLAGQGRTIDEIMIEQLNRAKENKVYTDMKNTIRELQKTGEMTEGKINDEAKNFLNVENQKFLLSWMKYNPVLEVSKNKAPMLFIYGTADSQIQPEEMKYFFMQENYFRNAIEQPRYKIIEDMNHVLKETSKEKKENEKTYIDPSYRLHPELVSEIVSFIKK